MATVVAQFSGSESSSGFNLSKLPVPSLPSGLISATTDDQVIAAWLGRSGLSIKTVANARKEVERFVMWCNYRGKGLRQVRYEDFTAYSMFMQNPQPADVWVSATRWPRQHKNWRPFSGALAGISQRQALAFIKGLFNWAIAAQYLTSNPAGLLGKMSPPQEATIERYLPIDGIAMMMESCSRLPDETQAEKLRKARARFLIKLLYLTGARLDEVANASMGSIRRDDHGDLWFHVLGKGKKKGKMPVSSDLFNEFKRYRKAYGLPATTSPLDGTPLIFTSHIVRDRATNGAIYKMVGSVLSGASDIALELDEPEISERLLQASPHWLRHSIFSHQADAGVPLKTIQLNARHSSLATTSRYLHKEDKVRHAETIKAVKMPTL
jgi:integrase/recombinase XerD